MLQKSTTSFGNCSIQPFPLFQTLTNENQANRNSLTTISGSRNYCFDLDIIRETPDSTYRIAHNGYEHRRSTPDRNTVYSRVPIIPPALSQYSNVRTIYYLNIIFPNSGCLLSMSHIYCGYTFVSTVRGETRSLDNASTRVVNSRYD